MINNIIKIIICILLITVISCNKKDKITNKELLPYTANGNINVRKNPNINSEVLSKVREGHLVYMISKTDKKDIINDQENFWYKIKTVENIDGFVFGENIKKIEPIEKYHGNSKSVFELFSIPNSEESKNWEIERDKYLVNNLKNVKREKDSLYLPLNNGKFEILTNQNDSEQTEVKNPINYYLLNYYENINCYLLYGVYFENIGYLLVNGKDGEKIKLPCFPVFSEKFDKFVCAELDGKGFEGVKIYSINNDSIKLIFEYMFDDNSFEFKSNDYMTLSSPLWKDDNLIICDRLNSRDGKIYLSKLELFFDGKQWILYK